MAAPIVRVEEPTGIASIKAAVEAPASPQLLRAAAAAARLPLAMVHPLVLNVLVLRRLTAHQRGTWQQRTGATVQPAEPPPTCKLCGMEKWAGVHKDYCKLLKCAVEQRSAVHSSLCAALETRFRSIVVQAAL